MSSRPAQENFQANTSDFQLIHHSFVAPVATRCSTSHIPHPRVSPAPRLSLCSHIPELVLTIPGSPFSWIIFPFCIKPSSQGAPGSDTALGCRNPGRTMDPQTPIPTSCHRAGARALLASKSSHKPLIIPSPRVFFPVSLTHVLQLDTTTSLSTHIPLSWHYFHTQQHWEEQESWVWCTKPYPLCSGRGFLATEGWEPSTHCQDKLPLAFNH